MVNINKLAETVYKYGDEAVDFVGDYLEEADFIKFLVDKKVASKNRKKVTERNRKRIQKSQQKSLENLTPEKKKELGIITAAEIPYVTLDDGVQAMTKKQAKEQQLREVRKKRYDQAVENLGIESLIRDTPVNPMQINPTKIIDPVTNDVIPYTKYIAQADNIIKRKDTGLLTTPTTTSPEAMAEFQVMSHAFRGMAMRDPYAAVKLYNKDPAVLDMLTSARNKYKSGMKDLLDQKEDFLNDKLINNQLQQVARKLYPDMDENYIQKSLLDLAHIFPFTETGKLYPGSKFLKEGGNPEYMYLAPSAVNRKVQTFIESRMRNAIDNMKGPQASELSDKVTDTVKKADDLLTKLKSLSVLPISKTKNLYAGDKRLISPNAVKLTRQDYLELFDYILEMNNIDDVMGKPFNRFADGGEVDTQPIPEITVEFGNEDEDTGMLGYLSDKAEQVDESLQNFVEDDLGGNPLRAGTYGFGKALEIPGDIYDSLPNFFDGEDSISKNLSNPLAPSIAIAKAGAGLLKEYVTDPLSELYKEVGDPKKTTSIPYPTGEIGDFKIDYLELPSDHPIAMGVDALKAVGLTAAEAFFFTKVGNLIKIGKDPKLADKVGKFVIDSLAVPTAALSAAWFTADNIIKNKDMEDGLEVIKEGQNAVDQIVQDNEISSYEGMIEDDRKKQKDFGKSQNPILNKADGGLIGDYLEVGSIPNTTGFAYGGEVTPGPFAESMQTGLEEEIDIQDLDLGPAYEGFEDLDIFEEAQRGGNEPIEVALNLNKVVGDVPKWVKQGKERFKMAMDNLLPGRNTPDTGTDVAIVDDVVENVTPLTRSEPGQIFYHQMEAELERGPKVYNSSKEVYDFLNARGIGKVEVIDSEIKPMLEKLEGMGQPITREMLLGVVRESPIRNVKSGGYGFLSDTLDGEMRSLNYSGYKEKGAIPNTDRERVLYVDPQDLRGDTGNLPSSMSPHSFSEPYVIAWSRLSDRELGGAFTGKTTTFADEIQSDIFQASQRVAGKLAAKMRHMADQGIPFDRIQNDLQKEMMQYFKDKGTVFRESMPSASALKVEYDKLVALQNQLRELSRTPVPEITDEMLTAAKGVEAQQTAILDNLVDKFNLDLNRQLYPNLPFKLRDQWADASIKRDIYEAAYRKFVLKDPNATDYYAITPANLVTKRYGQEGSTRTPQADRIADKKERLERWVRNGMEGDIPNSQYPGVGMYEFYGGPGTDVRTEGGKHFTSSMEKTLKRIAKENNVKVEVLPVKIGDDAKDVWNVVNKETGEILGTGDTARQADAIANDLLLEGMKIKVDRTKQFDTAPSFGVELTPSMAEAFKAYMASGGYVGDEEIVGAYGD